MSETCEARPLTTHSPEKVAEVHAWTKTEAYREKNFAREALVINPAHACNPLGAQYAAYGFAGCMPFVHGSQGCASYFRSTFNRHFREPAPAVCSSMSEDGAVFGGQANLHEGLKNAYELYQPAMFAIYTSCMPEVIGDDMNSFINNAKKDDFIPKDMPTPYANTPSFNGTHINGYDAMMTSILKTLTEGKGTEEASEAINLIPGFEPTTGNIKEYKRILAAFGLDYTVLGDVSDTLDSPLTGHYDYYPGGTPLDRAAESVNAKATFVMQKYATGKLRAFLKQSYVGETIELPMPMSVKKTDEFLLKLAEVTGKPVPEELKKERGLAVDAMTDAHQYLHGKKVALHGDPDQLLGMVSFLLEMGAKPWHILCSRSNKKWEKDVQHLLDASDYGAGCQIWLNRDLWHLRSLVATDPVDLLIGDSHTKFIAREFDVPLVRIGFPVIDRVNLHRYPTIGYQGVINLVTWLANAVMDEMDRKCEDRYFEMMR